MYTPSEMTAYLEVERMLSQEIRSQCCLAELRQLLYDIMPTTHCGTHKLLVDGEVVSRIREALDRFLIYSNIDHPHRLLMYHLVDTAEDDTSVTAYVSFRYAGHTAAAMLEIDMRGRIVPLQEVTSGDAIRLTWLDPS